MVEPPHLLRQVADVLVVGAGPTGAAAALAFASAGFTTISIGAEERLFSGRTVALFGRSIELMKKLGVWDEAEARGAPLRALRTHRRHRLAVRAPPGRVPSP